MRTYVIRVQEPRTTDSDPGALRGFADDIATGCRTAFSNGEELLRLLSTASPSTADSAGRHEPGGGQ